MKHVCTYTLCFTFLLGVMGLWACGKSSERTDFEAPLPGNGSDHEKVAVPENDLFTIKVGGIPVWVELAQTPETQRQGFMFREHLPENQGMLFVYPYGQVLSFWMSNTFIPLDIAFIDHNAVIVSIQQMQPLVEDKRYVSPVPVPYALEMNHGWFERNGVHVGDRVDF